MKPLSRIILAAILAATGLSLLTSFSSTQAAQDPEVQFQRAVQLETIEGNLNAAINLYKQVINNNGNNRAIAAKALLRLGGCYEKQGDVEATKAYEQLLRDYSDQADSAAEARSRLEALRKPTGTQSGPMTRRVWAGPKTDFLGEVSPDGKYISFVDWDTGDLAIRDLEKGINRRLTNKGTWEENSDEEAEGSIWSPDGKQVAYEWFQWKTEPYGYELRLISLDDPASRVLYRNKGEEWLSLLDWSPNGKQILAVLSKENGIQEIVLVSVPDGKLHILKRLPQSVGLAGAAISPDGRYFIYDYPQTELTLAHDIFIMPIGGGSETPLIEYPANDLVLGWSPDGKWVLFTSDRRGSEDIWAVEMEDGKPKEVPVMVKPAIGRITPLGFTRSGSFYFGVGGAANNVYVAKLDPKTGNIMNPPTKLVKRSEGHNRSPRYSPDGKHLAYISGGTGWGEILCIRSLETEEERQYQSELARAGARGFSCPRWSPDGKSLLLFGRDSRARYGIYYFDLETGKAANILRSSENLRIGLPSGWKDTRNFVYQRWDAKNDRGEICVRDLRDGGEKVIFSMSPARTLRTAYVSPDRQWVTSYESYSSDGNALRIISIESGEVRQFFRFSQGEGPGRIRHAWSADGNYVLYIRESEDGSRFEVWRISIETGEIEKTGIEMAGSIDHISAHPDGQHLVFQNMAPMGDTPAEVWVMENLLTQSRKDSEDARK